MVKRFVDELAQSNVLALVLNSQGALVKPLEILVVQKSAKVTPVVAPVSVKEPLEIENVKTLARQINARVVPVLITLLSTVKTSALLSQVAVN